jgi:hypothetical protein
MRMSECSAVSDQTNGEQGSEDQKERVDRELIEFLNELRVALPGVQVLFAFLLAVPFSQRFSDATNFQHAVFFTTLMCTTVSAALLMAPSAFHRLHFRQGAKEWILMTSNRLSIAGLAFLAVAMTGAIVLVTDVLYGPLATLIAGLATALMFAFFWALIPLSRR